MTATFTKQIFQWLHQVKADHDMPPSRSLFALELSKWFRENNNGVAIKGYNAIATEIGMSEPAVVALAQLFVARGHLRIQKGEPGRGRANQYWMTIKPHAAEVSAADKYQPTEAFEERKTPNFHVGKPQISENKTSAHRVDSS